MRTLSKLTRTRLDNDFTFNSQDGDRVASIMQVAEKVSDAVGEVEN